MTTPRALNAFGLICGPEPSPQRSSSELLARKVLDALVEYGVHGTLERTADHDITPGVEADLGGSDGWPALRERMLAADIFLIATPTRTGNMSAVARRVLERLDAELSDTDDTGRTRTYGKVAAAVVVGDEDSAHKISADLFQALNEIGFSLAPGAVTYCTSEAMDKPYFMDYDSTPEQVATMTASLAANAAHLARLLATHPYPPAN
ncbi:MAG TPA: NAD(P)H-dependent oxidoreductase [Mycobacteriales bacterium]|jgi:multimeric flavodoxin WrbA